MDIQGQWVFEKRNDKEQTLSFLIMKDGSPDVRDPNGWTEPDGTRFTMKGIHISLEKAEEQKRKLDEQYLAWGVLRVETDDDQEGLLIERIPRDFPKGKKIERLDGIYRLEKTCKTEKDAAEARDKLLAKADKKGKPLTDLNEKRKKRDRSVPKPDAVDFEAELRELEKDLGGLEPDRDNGGKK